RYIQGNWQIHYSYGGITGSIRHNYTNSFIEFRPDDIIYWKDNKIEIVNTKINWIRGNDQFYELTYIMVFDSYSWCVDGLRNDTLILYDNAYDHMTHYLTRK
ncbi:MAG TPA: hypothetical protein VEV16_09980, partial [Daejeonella sp.]|nr:hypothetical protein [Daejeonella sp.]